MIIILLYSFNRSVNQHATTLFRNDREGNRSLEKEFKHVFMENEETHNYGKVKNKT
jgi:hypothetical protein